MRENEGGATDKGLVWRIHEPLLRLCVKGADGTIRGWLEALGGRFSRDGRQVHGRVLRVLDCWRSADRGQSGIPPHTGHRVLSSRGLQMIGAGEGVGGACALLVRYKLVQSLWRAAWKFLR